MGSARHRRLAIDVAFDHIAGLTKVGLLMLVIAIQSGTASLPAQVPSRDASTTSRNRASQLRNVPPPTQASPAQEIMREQIEELARAGNAEAIDTLIKLFDQSSDQIIPRGEPQSAATLVTQRYTPVQTWVRERLTVLLHSHPELREAYEQRVLRSARAALAELQATHDLRAAELACQRYFNTSLGSDFAKLLTDLYLERGWTLAAMQTSQWLCPDLRARLLEGDRLDETAQSDSPTLPWSLIFPLLPDDRPSPEPRMQQLVAKLSGDTDPSPTEAMVAAAERAQIAASVSPRLVDWDGWSQFLSSVSENLPSTQRNRLQTIAEGQTEPRRQDDQWTTFAGNNSRNPAVSGLFKMERWPTWSHQALPPFMASSDQNPASQPRVGEKPQSSLPYYPVVFDDRVYVNAMTQILAYDLESGQAWPTVVPSVPLFDSHMSTASYLPLGYPILGSPRATLSVSQGCLYARMGSPVTGWAEARTSPTSSESYLIGLDLSREGAMLPGFPLRLEAPEFGNPNYDGSEFDGPPVAVGNLLLAPIVERDNVGVRRSLAAFDRTSGSLQWKSKTLATGAIEGSERANLISHQVITVAGGRIYYNTNLGAIVCVDILSGRIVWLTQYDRHVNEQRPSPQRFRYRDLNPCLIHRGLLYCAPQDCPEIFALDPATGDLVWSTDEVQVPDAIHLLGTDSNSLIVSGDRLTWLDRTTGRVQARYPGSHTPGRLNALPSPRGLGRGVISDGQIYWPVAGEILVFDARLQTDGVANQTDEGQGSSETGQPEREPRLLRRIRLGARGSDGGNLVVTDGYLLYASPMRLMAYRASATAADRIQDSPDSASSHKKSLRKQSPRN